MGQFISISMFINSGKCRRTLLRTYWIWECLALF